MPLYFLFLKGEILMRYQLQQGKMKVMCNNSLLILTLHSPQSAEKPSGLLVVLCEN